MLRGGFWRETPAPPVALDGAGPEVVAIVPARDEADVIAPAVRSLLDQVYPGHFRVVVVDDHSTDGTAAAARDGGAGREDRLTVAAAPPLAPGWTGKLGAVAHGVEHALRLAPDARYLWLTDADVWHDPRALAGLVARAERDGHDLVSLMVRLPGTTTAERFLVPAYVFFFQMLFPFSWVRDPGRATAAAAGGCMLLRRTALARIGGIASIRGEVIDDCALARLVKRGGTVWLGLAIESVSLRSYPRPADVWRLIARSAYTQLRASPLLLAATVAGIGVTYLAPPLLALFGHGLAATLGWAAWLAMTIAYAPTLMRCGRSLAWAPLLPIVAMFYLGATLDSARRYLAGRGGAWKGRYQAGGPR